MNKIKNIELMPVLEKYLKTCPLKFVKSNNLYRIYDPAKDALKAVQKALNTVQSYDIPQKEQTVLKLVELLKQSVRKIEELENASMAFETLITFKNHIDKFKPLKTYRHNCLDIENICKRIPGVFENMDVDQLNVIAQQLETCLNSIKITAVPIQVDNVKTQLQRACNDYFGNSKISIVRYSNSIEQAYNYIEKHPNTAEAKNLSEQLNTLLAKFKEQKISFQENTDVLEYKQLFNDLAEKLLNWICIFKLI